MTMGKQWKANGMLLLTAMIWGSGFVAQSAGMDYVEPFTFLMVRCFLAGLVLLPVIAWKNRRRPAAPTPSASRRDFWRASLLCGTALFAGSALQQLGLLYTTAGKSGFLTALYVVLVPLCGLFLGKRAGLNTWLSVVLAAAALYFLCVDESLTLGPGELLTLLCALCFALHILIVDRYAGRVDGVQLSCAQFFVCAVWCTLFAFVLETPSVSAVARCWLPIGYAGILSCGAGYTLQILGQRDAAPAVASILLSLESVFAVLFGALILHERLSLREYAGCAMMFAAVILAQLPRRVRQKAAS